MEPEPRLWPMLVASTFVDYHSYRFAPTADAGRPVLARGTLVGGRAFALSRLSVWGGTWIAAVTAAACRRA